MEVSTEIWSSVLMDIVGAAGFRNVARMLSFVCQQ